MTAADTAAAALPDGPGKVGFRGLRLLASGAYSPERADNQVRTAIRVVPQGGARGTIRSSYEERTDTMRRGWSQAYACCSPMRPGLVASLRLPRAYAAGLVHDEEEEGSADYAGYHADGHFMGREEEPCA